MRPFPPSGNSGGGGQRMEFQVSGFTSAEANRGLQAVRSNPDVKQATFTIRNGILFMLVLTTLPITAPAYVVVRLFAWLANTFGRAAGGDGRGMRSGPISPLQHSQIPEILHERFPWLMK